MGTTQVIGADKDVKTSHADQTWAFAAFGEWNVADGIVGDSGGDEAENDYAVVDDGGSQALLSAAGGEGGYAANYQLFPDAEQVNDAVYFGNDDPMGVIEFDVDTAAVYGGDSLTWEYGTEGGWSALTILHDNTDTTAQDGKRSFQQDGRIIFEPPSDWDLKTVNGVETYWVRARVSGANITQVPIFNGVNHSSVAPGGPFEAPCSGTVKTIRIINGNATLHTDADVKFYLWRADSLVSSGVLTFGQDQRQLLAISEEEEDFTEFDVEVGSKLAVVVTQEDGVNNPTNVLVELTVEPD